MIAVGTLKFDLESDNEPFVQDLFGRWDSFAVTSVEGVIDDVLSRYDMEDQEIIIESLDLDLETMEEDEFYDRFPKALAGKLDEVFSSYLRNKDKRPGGISIVPIRQSRLSKFIYFMTHGWWQWTREEETARIADLLEGLIKETPADLSRFFRENGTSQAVRQRMVSQFDDDLQERLVSLMAPSDAPFINLYVRFVKASHVKLERPDIAGNDFRDAIWLIVWTYLLSDSKGYFSRKQLIIRTLTQLSAHFNIPMRKLLDILTYRMDQLSSVRQVMPDLLLILAEIRDETASMPETGLSPDFLSREELRTLLSRPESARIFLDRLLEEDIYKVTERVIPSDSLFVIHYAQALDKEKERGLLEGKAGKEFRIVKWVFIFQVLILESGSMVERKWFVWSVLKKLASHYNLKVIELLSYFYRTLADGRVPVKAELRELIIALYIDAIEESPQTTSLYFPDELLETLLNSALCRRFLLPLKEEEIYMVVNQVIPSESGFIREYARVLDKGKEQGMLEGKAGGEFRILKWEFIFLVVLTAPVSMFSRKRFTRSVLSRLAGHYNLSVYELIAYFYGNVHEKDSWVPEQVRAVIKELYMDMLRESSEPWLTEAVSQARMAVLLENFVVDGQIPRGENAETHTIFACLLKWAVQLYAPGFGRKAELLALLADILLNRVSVDAALLRLLIVSCVRRQTGVFERQLDALLPRPEPAPAIFRKQEDKVVSPSEEEDTTGYAFLLNPSYKQVVEELTRFFHLGNPGIDEDIWLACIARLKDPGYRNMSRTGLLSVFWRDLGSRLSVFQMREVEGLVLRHEADIPGLSGILRQFLTLNKDEVNMNEVNDGKACLAIHNAGLVLLSPYFPILFNRMGLLDDSRRNFKDEDSQVKAIFATQRFVTDEPEVPECELILNKIMAGYETCRPLPRSCSFSLEELELISQLQKAILMNWDKMRNTSYRGFRETFILRAGKLEEEERNWNLTVSEKAFDVLLDTVPWGFRLVKTPWMAKALIVNWR